jgi:hypothetical protein
VKRNIYGILRTQRKKERDLPLLIEYWAIILNCIIFKKNSAGIVSSSTLLAYVSPLSMAESTDIKNHKNNKTLSIKSRVYFDTLLE